MFPFIVIKLINLNKRFTKYVKSLTKTKSYYKLPNVLRGEMQGSDSKGAKFYFEYLDVNTM